MNDINENIIKKHLTNPLEFEFSEKPWVIAKSRLDYDRKIRRFIFFGFLLGLLLLGMLAVLGNYWYNKKIKGYQETINVVDNKVQNNLITKTKTDTVFEERIIYIHDTLYKIIKIVKTEAATQENITKSLSLLNPLQTNSIFSRNNRNIFKTLNNGKNNLNFGLASSSFLNPIKINILNSSVSNNRHEYEDLNKLSSKLNFLKYNREIGYGRDFQYNKWINELARKRAKERRTLRYKTKKFLTGFNIVGYEMEPHVGGLYSLTFKKSNIGIFTGINSKVLFENGVKFTAGIDWIDYHNEFKASDISNDDFPKATDNGDIFDGVYLDYSYWLLPIGLEYHIKHSNSIHPYFGIGWAMKFGVKDIVKYEYHDINTYEEYKINKSFEESIDFNNYWIKTGIDYAWNENYSNSLEFSYFFGNKVYKFNYAKLNAIVLTLNAKYRF